MKLKYHRSSKVHYERHHRLVYGAGVYVTQSRMSAIVTMSYGLMDAGINICLNVGDQREL